MRTGLIILLITLKLTANAQTPTWQWARSGKSVNNSIQGEEGCAVATDIFGNVYITGNFTDSAITFGAYTLINSVEGKGEIFVTKYDAAGNVLWAKSGIGTDDDDGLGIVADASGNVYVTGYFSSPAITFGSYTLSNAGVNNIFLVKYDPSGNVLWAKSAGGTSADDAFSVSLCQNSSGTKVYVAGLFQSSVCHFDSFSLLNTGIASGGGDAFLVQYDASGNVLWARGGGGTTGTTSAFGVSADISGHISITGVFGSFPVIFGSHILNPIGNHNIFIVRYDASGNILWAKAAGSTNDMISYSIASDACGNAYVTGSFSGSSASLGSYTLINGAEATNTFIAKYDSSGIVQWAKCPSGGAGDYEGYSVATDISGNAYVSGTLSGSGGGADSLIFDSYTLYFGNADPMFIAKYDPAGNTVYALALASGGDDYNGIATDISCNVYVGGDFIPNPFVIGSDTLIRSGGENVFVAKLNGNCSGNQRCTPCEGVIEFPNIFTPNDDGSNDNFIPIKYKEIITGTLKIYNRWGEEVYYTDNLMQGWNGYYKNNVCSDGTYFWIAEYTACTNETKRSKGFLTLLK
ncbi:MAG: T9SS type B sorting domain-containing protein [Bacteroidia bacterium]